MKIGTTDVAGLTGGLYERFEGLGLKFFSALIGAVGAERLRLEYKRVTAGATLVGATLGALVGGVIHVMIAFASGTARASLGYIALEILPIGALMGSLLFSILAAIMIYYIKSLRSEEVQSASTPAPGTSFETILAEREKCYLDLGYPQKDAHREAWWFTALTTGKTFGRKY
ncbi:MAG: hypothetical protein ACJ76N_12300 [Thermoanaerobaculia bacterium]